MDEIKNEVKELTLIEQANVAAERLEKANIELKSLLQQKENLIAKERLGGRTSITTPEKPMLPKSPREEAIQAAKDFSEGKLKLF